MKSFQPSSWLRLFFFKKVKKRLDMKTGGFLHNPKEIVGGKNDYDFRKLLLFAIDDPQLS